MAMLTQVIFNTEWPTTVFMTEVVFFFFKSMDSSFVIKPSEYMFSSLLPHLDMHVSY